MHLVGYLEGIDSENGLEWPCSDSLVATGVSTAGKPASWRNRSIFVNNRLFYGLSCGRFVERIYTRKKEQPFSVGFSLTGEACNLWKTGANHNDGQTFL